MVDMRAIEAGHVGNERMRRMKLAIDLGRNRRRAAPTEGFDGRGDERPRSSFVESTVPFELLDQLHAARRENFSPGQRCGGRAPRPLILDQIQTQQRSEDAKRIAP